MRSRSIVTIILGTVAAIVVLLAMTTVLVPENTSPAFDVATRFVNAAARGIEEDAFPLLSEELQQYVTENCPDGRVSTCIQDYTPEEWGGILAAVYRRSVPEGDDLWHVQVVATYEEGQGFAGVCIYNRVEQIEPDEWRITGWSGFISCDAPEGRLNELRQDDAPNRVAP